MATIERSSYAGGATPTTLLSTELNSFASGSTALSAEQDNGTNHAIYGDFALHIAGFGANPVANTTVELYILTSIDNGTTYPDGSAGTPGTVPAPTALAGTFLLRAAGAQDPPPIERVELPPGKWKALLRSLAGQTMSATNNTLKVNAHELSSA